jgi:hypothetical protein
MMSECIGIGLLFSIGGLPPGYVNMSIHIVEINNGLEIGKSFFGIFFA